MPVAQRDRRPVYLNLFKIRQPIGAIVSITHRVTGVLLVIGLVPALNFLQRSLSNPQEYARVVAWLTSPPGRYVVLMGTFLFAQHFYSGVRHLLLDIDICADLECARAAAWLTFAASIATVLLVWVALP